MLRAKCEENGQVYIASEALQTFLDPNKESWVCPNCGEELFLKEEHIRIREDCPEEIWVTSHFAHSPNSSCKNAGESQMHYSKKLTLLNQLYSNKIPVRVGNTTLLIDYKEVKGVEENVGNRRADILVEFKEKDKIFGSGIVFEIAESEDDESLNDKLISWAESGYSFTYFKSHEFEDNRLKKGVIEVKYPFLKAIDESYELMYENIRENLTKIENLKSITKFKQKIDEEFTCSTCAHAGIDKTPDGEFTGMICCWKDKNQGDRKMPNGKFKPWHTCEDWKYGSKNLEKRIKDEIIVTD